MVVFVPYHSHFIPLDLYSHSLWPEEKEKKRDNYQYNGERIVGYLQQLENDNRGLESHIYPDPTGYEEVKIYLFYKGWATMVSITSFSLERENGFEEARWLIDKSLTILLKETNQRVEGEVS